jgi:hypothetical protein
MLDHAQLDVEDNLHEKVIRKIQKERRDSLEVLVVPFERPCWPQKLMCAS